MSWTNIRLIWFREIRDQLRDRRTLFTIAVLPLLLYPVLGMCFLQITQFMKEHPTRIWLVGADALPDEPRLTEGDSFAGRFCSPDETDLLQLRIDKAIPEPYRDVASRLMAQQEIRKGECDAVIVFPADFADQLAAFRERLGETPPAPGSAEELSLRVPQPEIFIDMASDKSRIAYDRVDRVLGRWRREIVRLNLATSNIPLEATEPFELTSTDISDEGGRRAAVWSKLLPFIVLIWALTGAFYPAIDLCAGEKERGTLETLLCSPAARTEIVGGKLLTVITFSASTALLNLFSMGITGTLIMRQISQMPEVGQSLNMGPPPLRAIGWLVLAVFPISALFSALALAIAAFARSSKEGQYYLMPLLLITLPLVTLPMLPAAELDWGAAIIPVSGMMLWLRALIEGEYAQAARFAIPVLGVTAICCWLAMKWAVRQFESESVLFRESEQIDFRLWMRHVVRDRTDTPSAVEAVLGAVLLLLITFFVSLQVAPPQNLTMFVKTVLITQIALIAGPVIIMAVILTRKPLKTLLLQAPRPMALPAAFLLALVLHPAVLALSLRIEAMYPLSEDTLAALEPVVQQLNNAPLWLLVLVVGLTPAICEELAFRGFVLSGLRHLGSKWAAIAVAAVFFGLTHGMLQQSLSAMTIGLVIGYIAVQSDSLFPGVVFHFTHNSLGVITARLMPQWIESRSGLQWFLTPAREGAESYAYRLPWVLLSLALAACILYWFHRLKYKHSKEEDLYEGLHHQ